MTAKRRPGFVLQFVGFVVGLALIAICLRAALAGDGASQLRDQVLAASPWVIAGLLATSLVSIAINGLLFWQTLRPVHLLRAWDVQLVNAMASFLNYVPLPLRLGLFARISYHWRVDKLSLPLIAAWLAAVFVGLAVVVGSVSLAMPLAPFLGVAGTAVLATLTTIVALRLAAWVVTRPLIAQRLRGAERMVGDVRSFSIATAYRVIDMAMWALRMPLAAKLVGVPLSLGQAMALGICAFVMSLNPFGRFGFREWAVAWIAGTLFAGDLSADTVTTAFAQLAIVESAAEGAVALVYGGGASLWCWRKVVQSRGAGPIGHYAP